MSAVNASRPDVIGKLPQLQNMVKRDPVGYRAEFLMQLRHFESEYQLFLESPVSSTNGLLSPPPSLMAATVAALNGEPLQQLPASGLVQRASVKMPRPSANPLMSAQWQPRTRTPKAT